MICELEIKIGNPLNHDNTLAIKIITWWNSENEILIKYKGYKVSFPMSVKSLFP